MTVPGSHHTSRKQGNHQLEIKLQRQIASDNLQSALAAFYTQQRRTKINIDMMRRRYGFHLTDAFWSCRAIAQARCCFLSRRESTQRSNLLGVQLCPIAGASTLPTGQPMKNQILRPGIQTLHFDKITAPQLNSSSWFLLEEILSETRKKHNHTGYI
ncbi:hypothetical protein BO94DRAFT_163213 [Aspergillus sclerotioniger CBS 115572]|uniref:Uncharacterized protein n=1 Tax=Aspergillus sclerotioniger CBS 115572 TaxID=1450535 RepID=A0A317W1E7_9EURO|nr:hypothetical protein BO94DRAFT_163213 [Aspergillus sclerotioniger CBS 115572]PWY80466.1 hypothetical protein BO94DRAFT_163213 [Aspergillus sclerotioniger CBS 115572]